MTKFGLIRSIYLYLAALSGLAVFAIGVGNLIDLGLKTYVFTAADEEQQYYLERPMTPAIVEGKFTDQTIDTTNLSAEEQAILKQSIADYKQWKEKEATLDPIKSQRHQRAAFSITMMLVGAPLYLAHWYVIKKEKE